MVPDPVGEGYSTYWAESRASSFGTCWASAKRGFKASSSMAAVMPPTANLDARSMKPRRSRAPWT